MPLSTRKIPNKKKKKLNASRYWSLICACKWGLALEPDLYKNKVYNPQKKENKKNTVPPWGPLL